MPKREKRVSSGPNQSYMISFGDTMTALLAFFIVLNSLASEQTGANLYSGTGSFIQATDSLGVPGIFPQGQSLRAIQFKTSSPLYLVPDEVDGPKRGVGPDDAEDQLSVRDRELDNFERMLNELERLHTLIAREHLTGEVTFDRHLRIPLQKPYLDASFKNLLGELRPFLNRQDSEAELIVWTPIPSPAAWDRSARLAADLQSEAIAYLQLNSQQASRLRSGSRQWSSSKLERPVLSIVIRRVNRE